MNEDTRNKVEGLKLLLNAFQSNNSRADFLSGLSGYQLGTDPKHGCLYKEFGYKEQLTYWDFRNLYERQGIAGGAIDAIAEKAFETMPQLVEGGEDAENKEESPVEKEFRLFEKRTKLFSVYMNATIRRSVGNYSGMIIQIADDKRWDQRAENVKPEQIIRFIPCWEHQLQVANYDQDQQSETYGEPVTFTYQEYDFNTSATQNASPGRLLTIDASRVIWFGDLYANGSEMLLGNLMLKKGYNDFYTLEKLIGSGGEGAYKNAARHIATSFDKDTSISDLMKMFGVTDASELGEVFNEITRDINSNFDAGLFGKATDYTVLSTSLPDMDTTFDNALKSAAASLRLPSTFIVGFQTGERASTEDGATVAKRITSYRNLVLDSEILNGIMAKLEKLGMWVGVEWTVVWDSLLDASDSEKIENAHKMAMTNQAAAAKGEVIYTQKEIRVAGGQKPEIELSKAEQAIRDEGESMDELPEE